MGSVHVRQKWGKFGCCNHPAFNNLITGAIVGPERIALLDAGRQTLPQAKIIAPEDRRRLACKNAPRSDGCIRRQMDFELRAAIGACKAPGEICPHAGDQLNQTRKNPCFQQPSPRAYCGNEKTPHMPCTAGF